MIRDINWRERGVSSFSNHVKLYKLFVKPTNAVSIVAITRSALDIITARFTDFSYATKRFYFMMNMSIIILFLT